jgi:hypothetical protein
MREQIGTLGVDAGLMYLGDPCYVMTQDCSHAFAGNWNNFCEMLMKDGYSDVMKYQDGIGIMVGTGYGDGEYPVFIERKDGRVASVTVEFISDDEDDY